jgi:beta-galactosidase
VGYTGDEIQSDFSIITAKEPTQIILSPDRPELKANGRDLCFVTIELQDENGNINPKSDDLIQFEIDGPGEIIAVGSSDPMSTESFQQAQRRAYKGRCLAIIKGGNKQGMITLTAKSKESIASSIKIKVK